MSLNPERSGWTGLCDRTLGAWSVVDRYTTRRSGSHVWRVRSGDDHEYVVKRHLSQIRHDREVHAYQHWTPVLGGRAPVLVAADNEDQTIILSAVPGAPTDRVPLHPARRAEVFQQAGALLRRMHAAAPTGPVSTSMAGCAPPPPAARLAQRFDHWLPQARPQLDTDDVDLLRRAARHLQDLTCLPAQPCHLDFQPHNWIIDLRQDIDPLLHVIDFEHSRVDVAIRDLVRLEIRCWSQEPELRDAFYDGYGRRLDEHENVALHVCAAIDAVSSLARFAATGDGELKRHGQAALTWLRDRRPRDTASSAALFRHLASPDATGRDLELLRTRSYRFSDDLRRYVFAEALVDRYLNGEAPGARTMAFVRQNLDHLRHDGTLPPLALDVVEEEDLDLDDELLERAPFAYREHLGGPEPELVAAVVGAPRSGTSHLVNLLARTGRFAYFTTASCWAWPTRNLHHPERLVFSRSTDLLAREILAVDNKRTRIVPGLVMPGEAEDLYARALPVYRHLGGHRYTITRPGIGDLDLLHAGCAAHLAHFDRSTFLTKSPFNSLRIPLLEQLWPGRTRYIHIVRDRASTADSMRRNGFEFGFEGATCSPEDAWTRFVDAVRRDAPQDRLFTLTHDDLTRRPEPVVNELLTWLGQS